MRLPAGVFEIDTPLRISQEDVLIEGSGTATHIKNVNTAGLPAIELDNPNHELKSNMPADAEILLERSGS